MDYKKTLSHLITGEKAEIQDSLEEMYTQITEEESGYALRLQTKKENYIIYIKNSLAEIRELVEIFHANPIIPFIIIEKYRQEKSYGKNLDK